MAAVVARPPDMPSRNPTPPPSLTINTSTNGTPAAVPNKHIPICSPGAPPQTGLISPPPTPPDSSFHAQTQNLLYPPDPNRKIAEVPPVYAIDARTVADAIELVSKRPSPDLQQIFPWLHGLHPSNQIQNAFFSARRKLSRRTPRCLRGLTLVKARGDLSHSRLKGAIAPDELLAPQDSLYDEPCFLEVDPKVGFSVRNFQIQACKMATVSDIIVYGDDSTPVHEIEELGRTLSQAQVMWRDEVDPVGNESEEFNTFVVRDPFKDFEESHGHVVALNSEGDPTGHVLDFSTQERIEMSRLSRASEIARNVWLGPTPDSSNGAASFIEEGPEFDILIEASDLAALPDPETISDLDLAMMQKHDPSPIQLEFPSSGSFAAYENGTQDEAEVEKLLMLCRWIYDKANADDRVHDDDAMDVDVEMGNKAQSYRVLIHCGDGYTESTLLGIAYFMFVEGLPAHEAWIRLHNQGQRNFFAYPTDKAFLENIQFRVLQESPSGKEIPAIIERPRWMRAMDGSLPSRILPYLYLGNLNHAQNPQLLKELGITRVLSVGESISWPEDDIDDFGLENFLYVDRVQDNGVDSLTEEFARCLEFIGMLSRSPSRHAHWR